MTSQNNKVDTDAAGAPDKGVGCGALVRRGGNVHPGYMGRRLERVEQATHKQALAQQNYTLYFHNGRWIPGLGLTRETLITLGSCFPPNAAGEPHRGAH